MAEKPVGENVEVAPEKVPSGGAGKLLLPVMLAMLIGVPLVCYLMIDFLVMPKLIAVVEASANPAASGSSKTPAKAAHGAAEAEATVDLGKFVTNVGGSGSSSFLRINLALASANPEIKEILKSREVPLRDAVITVISAQSLADMEKTNGREETRRLLLDRINGILGGPVVSQIYFTEFVIQ